MAPPVPKLSARISRLLRRAPKGRGEAMLWETSELIPSRASGHLKGAVDLPPAQKARLTSLLRPSKPGASDPYVRAAGLRGAAPEESLGQFIENASPGEPPAFRPAFRRTKDGKVFVTQGFHNVEELPVRDYLPRQWDEGFVDSAGRFYTRTETVKAGGQMRSEWARPQPKTDYNPNITSRIAIPSKMGVPDMKRAQALNTMRSAVDVQAAGAAHSVVPSDPKAATAGRLLFDSPLDDEQIQALYRYADQNGLNVIATGRDNFTVTGEFGSMPAAEFQKRVGQFALPYSMPPHQMQLGVYHGFYNEMPAPGGGAVTKKLLKDVSPALGRQMNTPELRAEMLRRNAAEQSPEVQSMVGPPREDVLRLRSLLGQGGMPKLRSFVKKHGTKSLPGLALPALLHEEEE